MSMVFLSFQNIATNVSLGPITDRTHNVKNQKKKNQKKNDNSPKLMWVSNRFPWSSYFLLLIGFINASLKKSEIAKLGYRNDCSRLDF